MHVKAATVDDLMRTGIRTLRRRGLAASPKKGATKELCGCSFTLTNPRARLSRSSGRGLIFSPLGELSWYLSGSNRTDDIEYYIHDYANYDEDGIINGAYGPRLFSPDGPSQVDYVIEQLKTNPSSRQAIIQIFDRADVATKHRDVPCTCTLQFLLRDSRLIMVTHMRSNDAWKGFPHDIFCMTMLQEIIATELQVELGEYIHLTGSYHLYETDRKNASYFLDEGWQSTGEIMPQMPSENPRGAIESLLQHEIICRTEEPVAIDRSSMEAYWADLGDCLTIYGLIKRGRAPDAKRVADGLHDQYFRLYVNQRLGWN